MNFGIKADGAKYMKLNRGGRIFHKFLKNQKNRIERRRARQHPGCLPSYGIYNGWEA